MNPRRIAAAVLTVGTAIALLAACAAGIDAPGTPAPSQSAPVETPSETPGVGMASFDTIDGTWCAVEADMGCMTIAGGEVSYDGGEPESILGEPTVTEDTDPCHSSYLESKVSGMAEVALFYCPAGYTPDATVDAEIDDIRFDRIFLTQNPPFVDVWYRDGDLAAALAG